MTGKVIQGFFVGGRARVPAPVAQPKAMPRPPGPPVPAFAGRPPVAQARGREELVPDRSGAGRIDERRRSAIAGCGARQDGGGARRGFLQRARARGTAGGAHRCRRLHLGQRHLFRARPLPAGYGARSAIAGARTGACGAAAAGAGAQPDGHGRGGGAGPGAGGGSGSGGMARRNSAVASRTADAIGVLAAAGQATAGTFVCDRLYCPKQQVRIGERGSIESLPPSGAVGEDCPRFRSGQVWRCAGRIDAGVQHRGASIGRGVASIGRYRAGPIGTAARP